MPPTRLLIDVLPMLADRINNGERLVHVARDMGYTATGLRGLLRSKGLQVNTTSWNKLSAPVVDEAIRRISAGATVSSVSADIGVTHAVLNGHFQRRTGGFVGRHKRQTALTIPTNPLILSYVAGLFDGEGTIVKNTNSGGWRIALYNTDDGVMEFLGEVFGRSYLTTRKRTPARARVVWKPCHQFCLCNMIDVHSFLSALLPYLIIKKKKAAVAVADLHLRTSIKRAQISRPPGRTHHDAK